MAIGRIRALFIIALFATSAAIPVVMETSVVPMINLLNFVDQFVEISYDPEGNPTKMDLKFDALLSSIKGIECLADESSENQTVIQLTLIVKNTDLTFDMLFPGIDMTIYWKAGLPYEREKDTILEWKNAALNATNPHPEPNYDTHRWTRVIGIKIDATRIHPGFQRDLAIKLYLYNDEWDRGKSSALGQMIGTILRTQSTKDSYTNETLMHIAGSASLDIPGLSFGLGLDLGLDLSGFLNLTQLLGGLGGTGGTGGESEPSLFDLLFDVPPNILDIQNYNDSNGNFMRDYYGIDNVTGLKQWSENLYQHGAISAYLIMDLVNQLGMSNFNITLMKSSHNPDDADVAKTWNPEIGGASIDKNTTMNQIFLYIPDSPSLYDSSWGNKIFGLFGFSSDQYLYDYPEQGPDLGDGRIIAGGTLRLTGDLRQNSNFSIGDGLGALITQAIKGILPIGIFGAIDLKLNDMPLSLCLDMPLEINLTSFLGMMMGGEEEGATGDIFSMLLDYFGLKSILLNGLAINTFNSLLQLNFTTNLDMFLPYGIYMPSEAEYDNETGTYTPYLGVGGGPIQIFNEKIPTDWENWTAQAQEDWEEIHLIMNITSLDSKVLMESMAKLMATIGRTDQGEGLAYLFEDDLSSNANHGNLLQYLANNGQLPTAKEDKSSFSFTADDFILSLNDIVPDFGSAIKDVAYQMGIDPLFIEYLNNSIPHDNAKSILEDLLSIKQILNLLNQEGPKNDIIDYLLDSRITYNETAQVLSANTIQTTYDGVKTINSISNGTYEWWNAAHDNKSFTENGLITVNVTKYGDSLIKYGPIMVNYTTNKLHLLDVSNLLESILNLVFGSSESGTGGMSTELMTQVFTLLPGALDAMGIDFDRILPDLITYLRVNLSQPAPKGYGIKPFEMIDVAYHALFGADTGQVSEVFSGPSRDLIDNMIKEVVSMFIEQADPFQLGYSLMGDLTPVLDYLNRSQLFSREVLIPMIASLFPSGGELQTGQEESIALEDMIDIIMPLISEMLVGGDVAHFDHQALNPFALLSSAECIQYLDADPVHLADLAATGYPVYQMGYGNYTADFPRYDNLRLMSNLTLGLLMSGFNAEDLWSIINLLGLIDLGGGGGDILGGLKPLLSLLGTFVPPTEWDSLIRELGIWSTWEGDFDTFMAWITVIGITIPFDLRSMVGGMINLEKLLATGQLLGGEFVQLCLYENQSYGNPYSYIAGYDSSYNTGPYRDFYYGTEDCDNWGWVPYGWDPGGHQYGTPPDYSPQEGQDYPDSFIARLISTIPVEFDVDVLDMDPIDVTIGFDVTIWIFTIHIDVRILMQFSPQLFMRIRLEGNPSALTSVFEDEGIPLMGLASHFVGGDLAGLVTDLIDALTNPAPTGGEAAALPELDLLSILQSFLNAKVDLLTYFKFLVDPEFMKASQWYLDSSSLDMNATAPTLVWDDYPNLGDHDNIPDEYPWYRFNLPIYNQNPAWVNYGPSSTQGRTPAIIDQLTPAGPPGSGWWEIQPDGLPDGIQHYWYDTPYAYVNTTVRTTDPWVMYDPYRWNDNNLPGGPLLKDKATGQGLPSQYWDATDYPSLYYVPRGTTPGFVGDVTVNRAPYTANYPIPPFNTADRTPFPNIWRSFNITLNQTDYRFGYWSSYYDATLGKNVEYLETKPFWDLLSYAFYPQLGDLLDLIAPLATDLIISMLMPTDTSGGYKGDWGYDYYHLLQNASVYSKFGLDAYQPLCMLGMLEWLWEGAGQRWNGSQVVPYIEPYTVPNLQGSLDWLAAHGFTIDFIIKNLDKIFDMFSTEQEGTGVVDLAGDLAGIFSTETMVNVVNSIEDYMLNVVAQNPDGTGNRTEATRIVLSLMKDMTEVMDIYPVKALRGALNYLMPRLTQATGEGSGMPSLNQLDLGTFLEDSGLLDIIFYNFSKLGDLNFPLSIHQSSIDLYLFGQLIEDIPLNLDLNLDLASLMGGGDKSDGGASGADVLNELPISFPEGRLPYIELATFNGPFNISFALFNTTGIGSRTPVRFTNVTIGEVWFNETNGLYIFNRTQSSYEYEHHLSGWTNPDGTGVLRTYVRPNSLLRSDASGIVQYSSVIEADDFGWVDPYIYIHVERPNQYQTQEFYWWNVTGHPVQKTLAGHTPPYKARWIDDGEDILVQSANTLPSSTINIDNDAYWEIFARVEIDGRNMPTHEVVYVRVGNVQSVQIANATGGVGPMRIQINASHTEATANWRIFAYTDQTKYVINQEITPTGSSVVYPTISQVISGFHLQTARWNDDSLYRLKVDYVNLTGSLVGVYDWRINRTAGDYQNNVTYPSQPSGFRWTTSSGIKTLTMQFQPLHDAEWYGNYKYSNINVDLSNFKDKTIKSVNITLKITKGPEVTGTSMLKRYSEDFAYVSPAPTTYYLHQNVNTDTVKIQGYNNSGATNLNLMKATSAWVNITAPIPANAFLNGVDWYVRAAEAKNGSMPASTTNVSRVVIQFYNETSNRWLTLLNYAAGTKQQVNIPGTVDARYTGRDLWDWGLFRTGGLYFQNGAGGSTQIGMTHELYLTSRNLTNFEDITLVKFAVYLRESPSTFTNDGLGYQSGSRSYNSSVLVSFKFYPFVSSWGLGAIEIPEGFVSNFTVNVVMYDPLLDIQNMAVGNHPNASITYNRLGPLNTGATVNIETGVPAGRTFFARKVLVYLEAWDSLTREDGDHGDILFKDNFSAGTIKLVYLSQLPSLNTTIEVVDLEAKMYINVTIPAGQTLRNYYLKMNITPGLGYETTGYTGNYRFSVGTDVIGGNSKAISSIGAYPSKKVLKTNVYGFPISLQVGKVDLDPFTQLYHLYYILTFDVSPQFLMNATARERFYFSAVWEKAAGSYEVRSDKMETVPARVIDIVFK